MTDSSSWRPDHRERERSREHDRLKRVIEQSEALPSQLRTALLKRLEQGSVEVEETEEQAETGVKKAINTLKRAPSEMVNEVVHRVGQRVEELRGERVEQVKSEVRRLVERVDLQGEVLKLLSYVSIELKTTIKLEPKEDSQLGIKPVVKTHAKLRWRDQESSSEPNDSQTPDASES